MTRLNLSDWAIRHRSFVVFLMLMVTGAGLAAYFELGRSEDPAFSIKTMVVQAAWPGATMDDTLTQLTERIERKLQETPNLDYLRSHTSPGQTTIFVNVKGTVGPKEIPDVWYEVRKKVGDIRSLLPAGVVGPTFNDEFGDTFGLIYGFTADGFTHRELRDHVEDVRSQLLHVPDVSKIDVIGAQDEKIFLEFSTERLAGLGLDEQSLLASLKAQNAVTPAGVVQTANEKILVRVSGDIRSERDLLAVNFVVNGRMVPLSDIAAVRRSYGAPHSPCSA
jgi:multidrug efflux pump subunit AcrB